jgi:hypothetical protein
VDYLKGVASLDLTPLVTVAGIALKLLPFTEVSGQLVDVLFDRTKTFNPTSVIYHHREGRIFRKRRFIIHFTAGNRELIEEFANAGGLVVVFFEIERDHSFTLP